MVPRVARPLANGTSIPNSTYSIVSTDTSRVSGFAFSTAVTSAPILAVSKTDSPDPVAAGGNLTYTLSYSNTGKANATGVVLNDTVPANTTFVSATARGTLPSGVVTLSPGNLAARASGSRQMVLRGTPAGGAVPGPVANLAAGASGSAQMFVLVASPLATGTSITTSTSSIFFFNDTATTEISTLSLHAALPILAVSKTDSPDPVAAG